MSKVKRNLKRDFSLQRIRQWAVRQPEIAPMTLKVLILWLEEPDWRGPTHREYAKLLNSTPKTIYMAYRRLREIGLLEDISEDYPNKKGGRTRTYQLCSIGLAKIFKKYTLDEGEGGA